MSILSSNSYGLDFESLNSEVFPILGELIVRLASVIGSFVTDSYPSKGKLNFFDFSLTS
mgnify:CR=1 FL=1